MKKNYSISFDISTSNVGLSVWDEKGKLLELKHLELKIDNKSVHEEDRYIHKANLFKKYLIELKNRLLKQYDCNIENIFVEAPLQNTKVNINTTAKLLSFNGISCYILYEVFDIIPLIISVYDSRKLFCPELIVEKKEKNTIKRTLSFPKDVDKKEYILKKVTFFEPQINWFYDKKGQLKKTNYDMSDSFCVGIAGLIILDIIEHDEWISKNSTYNEKG